MFLLSLRELKNYPPIYFYGEGQPPRTGILRVTIHQFPLIPSSLNWAVKTTAPFPLDRAWLKYWIFSKCTFFLT